MLSTLTPPIVDSDEVRTEAHIVLRAVEHIAFDLDRFSRSIRAEIAPSTAIDDVECHLAQARRNCADAATIAESVIDDATLDETAVNQGERLRDAFALLALADTAYLRAFEVAGAR